jgi:hypothetical protein
MLTDYTDLKLLQSEYILSLSYLKKDLFEFKIMRFDCRCKHHQTNKHQINIELKAKGAINFTGLF